MEVGTKVEIVMSEDAPIRATQWWPKGRVTGTVQKVFKNGKVAVAVDQLRKIQDGGDGLKTLHFESSEIKTI